MEINRTFRRPGRVSAERWRFVLNLWAEVSLIGGVASGPAAIMCAVLVWSVVPRALSQLGWTTALIVAAIPFLGFAMSGVWWWMFLSSLRSSRRFPPTGYKKRATAE